MKTKHSKNYQYLYKILFAFLILVSLGFTNNSYGQDIKVNGIIADSNGVSLPGATITIKEMVDVGAQADFDGSYSIVVPNSQSTLVFRYLGYIAKEIVVGSQTVINVVLEEDAQSLDEIVVVGYSTQKKANLTGAVSSISGDELAIKPLADARQALQGVAPGLTIIDRGGSPGHETMSFKIRGIGSVSASTNPLVLIDGIESPISEINVQDIKSVSVLKDAASSSIYGARAANGVILITTKRGKYGKMKVSIDTYTGWQTPATLPELVGAEDYLNLVNEALVNAGLPIKYTDEYIQNTVSGVDPVAYPYTNLFKELYNSAPLQNLSVSISGGSEVATAALSINYLDQDGMIENTSSKRIGARLNTDLKLSDAFTARANIYFSNRETVKPARYDAGIAAIVGSSPVIVPQYANGAYGLNKDNQSALGMFRESGQNLRFFEELSLNAGLDWQIIDGLKLVTDYSYQKKHRRYKDFRKAFEFLDPNDLTNVITRWTPNQLWEHRQEDLQQIFKSVLTYSFDVKNHAFNILGGLESIEYEGHRLSTDRQGIYNEDSPELNTGDVTTEHNSGFSQDWALMSYFGRLNYSFNDRYLVEANIRYDGSSRFAKGHKWGVFPSFSAGWIVSNENFMSDNSIFKNLKLRASWGQLGNQDIGFYRFSSSVSTGVNYSFNDNEVNGYTQTSFANENITWETAEQLNFGVDMSFLNGRLNVTADWFDKQTKDMLLKLPISPLVGLSASEINIGSLSNKGWELAVNYTNRDHEFKYSAGFNLTDVKNELTDFGGLPDTPYSPGTGGSFVYKVGEALTSLYGYKSDGLFQTQAEINSHPTQPNQAQLVPGDIKLVDINGDGVINDDDRTVIGNTNPRYEYSFNFSADYKGFDVNIFLQGVGKAENYFFGAPNEGPNFEIFTTSRTLDRWTPDNPNASFPRLHAASNKNNSLRNDFWIRDSKYLRLKNVQLGYSLGKNILNKLQISKLRIYTGATNLFTITNVESGLDPETFAGRPNYYPPTSTYTLGVQVAF
jgi:TonB-linked SusC/RagA family outer membrane protein